MGNISTIYKAFIQGSSSIIQGHQVHTFLTKPCTHCGTEPPRSVWETPVKITPASAQLAEWMWICKMELDNVQGMEMEWTWTDYRPGN